ncbi:hypothetical protein LCGC14_0619090 [marine sediment metagenome]|uniref:Uncharacterized protein n=1 Tax=marine sediment metagenome TaxID=412755 RepID=A0A0F9RAD4_9ZZZZ
MTIREEIIDYLEDHDRKTIKEIATAKNIGEAKIRTKIYETPYGLLAKGIVVKVSHEKRTGYFSLKENAKAPNEELIDNLVELMVKSGVISEDYGIDISEKQIEPNIKRLTESGRIG